MAKKEIKEVLEHEEQEVLKHEAQEVLKDEAQEVLKNEGVDNLSFKFEGRNYQFTKEAPESILINGAAKTQKEIIKDDELLLQLIGGGSGLIKKIT